MQHLAKINEGASILLTWIINFVKWNAGVVRYKFHMSADLAQQRRESIEQAKQVDDLKGEDPAGYGTGYT